MPVLSYGLAVTLGSVATAGVLHLLGSALADISNRALVILMSPIVISAIALELKGRIRPLPESRAQVPRRWTTWRRRWATAAAFGFALGLGVFTLLHHATIYVLAALIVIAPSLTTGFAIATVYGFTRGLLLLLTWLKRGRAIIEYLPADGTVVARALALIATIAFCGALFLLI